jgi:DNA polymerase-3 subunit alpha
MKRHADYVPLHLHTEYSLLDGAIRIDELVQKASEYRMPAIAITDHGNLFGAIEFYKKAVKAGLKPIIGCEVYLAPDSRFSRKVLPTGEKAFHLILLAKDMDGYKNLMQLSSKAYIEGFYYKPRIDIELLQSHSSGLIGLSACMHGEVPYYIGLGDIDRAREAALRYKQIFGDGNFYLELQDNGLKEQGEINRALVELSKELQIPVVATNDCHYLRQDDYKAHDILLCIQTGKSVHAKDRLRFDTDQLYFKSPEEIKRSFSEIPESIKNTIEIAEKCNLDLRLGEPLLPRYKLPEDRTAEQELERLAEEGLKRKLGGDPPEEYIKRLQHEVRIINKMGFAPYFLIVWDFINFAKSRGIPVGPGRGSAAGSLVAYSLNITEIDPIKYNLFFERFLNPDRISMPDIDVDFCKDKRDEVIRYVAEKYGVDQVAHIITFGTMKARAVIRDVGRALDIPYSDVDRIAKMVPAGINVTIDYALQTEQRLRDAYEKDSRIKELIDIARRLEGLCRHASTHAAGVVISPSPLTNYTPLYKNPSEDTITTQFDMKSVEAIGLLKFDFLGLKTLTVIEETLRYLKESGKDFDLSSIPLDDPKTYQLLSRGQTTGVFQLESSGMKDLLVRLEPGRFEDLIALVALFRPGPLGSGMVEDFIQRKKGHRKVEYDIPQLKEILDETYGVILYQEQVMRIAHKLAGFSMAEADILRKAMGKKQKEQMEALQTKFVSGAVKNGIPEEKAKRLFEVMSHFGEYGFNKSHSAAYAYLAYQTAYLKAHFPVEFMAANLSKEENSDKVVLFIKECRQMGIQVLPPDINLSESKFRVIGNSIRFGLEAVKGIGEAAVSEILRARKEGPFRDIEDLLQRVDTRKVNRKALESLVKAGALDSLVDSDSPVVLRRAKAMKLIEELMDRRSSPGLFGQQSLLSSEKDDTIEPWSEDQLLAAERESLGFYITGHPIDRYNPFLQGTGVRKTRVLEELPDSTEVTIAGIISTIKRTTTKTKERMAIFTLEDDEGSVECITFPDTYSRKADIIVRNNLVFIDGTTDKSEKGVKVIVRDLWSIDDVFSIKRFKVELTLASETLNSDKLREVKETFISSKGDAPVYIRLRNNGYETVILTDYSISPCFETLERLSTLLGSNSIRLIPVNN